MLCVSFPTSVPFCCSWRFLASPLGAFLSLAASRPLRFPVSTRAFLALPLAPSCAFACLGGPGVTAASFGLRTGLVILTHRVPVASAWLPHCLLRPALGLARVWAGCRSSPCLPGYSSVSRAAAWASPGLDWTWPAEDASRSVFKVNLESRLCSFGQEWVQALVCGSHI